MKFFKDGDQLCIVEDDFVNLQESPAVFYPLKSDVAKTVSEWYQMISEMLRKESYETQENAS